MEVCGMYVWSGRGMEVSLLPVSPWWLRGLLRLQGFYSNRLDLFRKRKLRQGALEKR